MYRYLVVLFDDWSIMMMKSELNQVSQKCAYHLECVLLAGRLMIHQIWWLCITGSPNIENRNFRTILAVIHFISNDKRCQIFFPFDRFILKKLTYLVATTKPNWIFFRFFQHIMRPKSNYRLSLGVIFIPCFFWFFEKVFFWLEFCREKTMMMTQWQW